MCHRINYGKIVENLVNIEEHLTQLSHEICEVQSRKTTYAECIQLPGSKYNKNKTKSGINIKNINYKGTGRDYRA